MSALFNTDFGDTQAELLRTRKHATVSQAAGREVAGGKES